MSCNDCKEKMGNRPEVIPYAVHEISEAKNERILKKLITALIIAIALIFASNAIWLYAWCQYDYTSEETIVEQSADGGGNANYIGANGDINNGVSESDS